MRHFFRLRVWRTTQGLHQQNQTGTTLIGVNLRARVSITPTLSRQSLKQSTGTVVPFLHAPLYALASVWTTILSFT